MPVVHPTPAAVRAEKDQRVKNILSRMTVARKEYF
jgi:hypothetical protein